MKKKDKHNSFAIIEVFGCSFGLLIVFFIILNIINESQTQERLDESSETGSYRINWQNQGEGFVIVTFADKLHILENKKSIATENICSYNSEFIKYAKSKYTDSKKQLIFAIVNQGVATMRVARDCLMSIYPNQSISIGWIAANNALIKAVGLEQIPPFIEKAIR